jgi:DNA-binding LacI/PurR family transcriptional regulator
MGNAFFVRSLQGVVDETERSGYRLQVLRCPSHRLGAEETERLLAAVAPADVAGVLLPWVSDSLLARLRAARPDLRVVSTTTRFPPAGVSSVLLDYSALGFHALRWLAGSGARTAALIYVNEATVQGARNALAATDTHDSVVNLEFLRGGSDEPAAVEALVRQVLDLDLEALAFDDDRTAAKLLAVLEQRAPDFLAERVVVTQANEGEDLFAPAVTRLVTDGYEIGAGAIRLLRRMIDENRSLNLSLLVQPRLVAAQG